MVEEKFNFRLWEHNLTENDKEQSNLSYVLGMNQNRSDTLQISFEKFKDFDFKVITKRDILAAVISDLSSNWCFISSFTVGEAFHSDMDKQN